MSGDHVRLGVILLCHQRLDLAARMARLWAEGGAAVSVHIDGKTPIIEAQKMRYDLADLPQVRFCRRRRCEWGHFSLVQATQDAAELLLDQFPDLTHVLLASGSCLPLRPVVELCAFLGRDPTRDHIESTNATDVNWAVGGLDSERFTLFFPFDWRRHPKMFDGAVRLQLWLGITRRMPAGIAPHLGSQWWCLTARTLRAILSDPRREEFDRYFRGTWIPDECYFQTLARRHSARIESRSLTLAKFDDLGRPYQFYDDQQDMLQASGCFVARKIWPRAAGLYAHFPQPAPDAAQPDPGGISRLIDRAVERRKLGRPGLYMQSRFPRKDRENGKTSAPYAVFQGFTDLFPDFEAWLAPRISADVHGHLFSPDQVEFAGRPAIGPGAIPDSPALRDHDPKGFLTSLIRISPRMQVFQYAPRDSQKLNWFMATDPNARLFVITGAWAVPLIGSEMPFDDIRRAAALFQRAEQAHLQILRSVWVKAQVGIWDLAAFLDRPDAVLDAALRQFDGSAAGAAPLPPMRSLDGLPDLLRRLRNAGLQSYLTGNINPADESEAADV
ncbi:MAG: beta-1,6-N-acetylglucosaminyltransferase [Paracoccus sp. (in: a-proteobacteria)]|uniref:DUF5927 domain-containing protein n=1 Tax=Paracoccus sp. TaxID=267 RepID=UPI0026DFCF0A|nr:beta-1,6-N-acetylglucosaminyltransferase [Paracoccus sp. (in: a-proteobacteria)]MDO5630557.1 beta-1,6-N-acetylglucosaminyltransferase [Paracoccus sp. (in: a-proteobacteria)]